MVLVRREEHQGDDNELNDGARLGHGGSSLSERVREKKRGGK